ncbi:MAG: energy transducer TonB [Candidatus Latescibacterota bacterium]|nr:MAG: energy transducer TonB [Candidatus Latescibacterota bacterium]
MRSRRPLALVVSLVLLVTAATLEGVARPSESSAWFANTLEAYATHLAEIDLELAQALADLEGSEDPAGREALAALRERANRIVYRVTQSLGDDYPCRGTTLPQAPASHALPRPDEYVDFDVAPELVSMDPVHDPESAREAQISGTVLVRVLVGTDGHVLRTFVLRGVTELSGAALRSARSAVFKPARVGEEPVAVWMVIPIEFALK